MKKYILRPIALLLAILLTACSAPQTVQPEQPQPEPSAEAAKSIETPAPSEAADVRLLAEAEYPELPEAPSEAALYEADEAIYAAKDRSDREKMEASQKLWEEYLEQDQTYRSAVLALKADTPTAAELAAFHDFTIRVSDELLLSDTGENTVYSPANLWLALAMAAEVTGGETRQEFLDLLGVSDPETLRAAASSLWKQLYEDSDVQTTLLANAFWTRPGFAYRQETLDALAEHYYADAFQVPMGTDAADRTLRDWLNAKTGGLLEDSVNGIETKPETVLMLASALYFQSAWRDEFYPEHNTEEPFATADGSEVTATFMHQSQIQDVWQQDGYTMATLRFDGSASMRFLLPDEGVSLDGLLADPAVLAFAVGNPGEGVPAEVRWSVPKFDIAAEAGLIDALKTLGVVRAFQPDSADFTPLTDEPMLYISTVEHAARVKIDEEGCEAAAYTLIAAEESGTMEPPEVIEMNLNRPFLFVITGIDGMPLFVGAVRNPTN